jgi:hypothetical protein
MIQNVTTKTPKNNMRAIFLSRESGSFYRNDRARGMSADRFADD